MPDPRRTLSHEGIAPVFKPYKIDNSTILYDATKARGAATTMIDKAVTLSADGTVALAADGDAIEGRLESVESDGYATVQTGGTTNFPAGVAAAVTRGKKIVGALGAASAKGYIREVNTAVAAELGKERGRIVDASNTAAIVVDMD